MVHPVQLGKNTRMSYSKIGEVLEMPNLIEVQKNSYKWFIEEGIREVFHDVSPITDYTGNISFYNKPLNTLQNQSANLHIGYMLQHDHLFDWRTIYKNVCLGLEIKNIMTEKNLDYVLSLLEKYGLYDFKDKKPSQLSGGMRQRAALIRTLALNPELLLLDEPFSALDYQTRLQVSNDIGNIIRENKKTAILVTHNLSEAISLADKIIVLTQRPASIKRIANISLTITDNSSLGYRSAPEFNKYFNEIWEDLCDES